MAEGQSAVEPAVLVAEVALSVDFQRQELETVEEEGKVEKALHSVYLVRR